MVTKLLTRLAWWWIHRVNRLELEAAIRAALPNGTRVRMTCQCKGNWGAGCHEGIWTTEYKPEADDYRLTRLSDGETTFAVRSVLEVVVELIRTAKESGHTEIVDACETYLHEAFFYGEDPSADNGARLEQAYQTVDALVGHRLRGIS